MINNKFYWFCSNIITQMLHYEYNTIIIVTRAGWLIYHMSEYTRFCNWEEIDTIEDELNFKTALKEYA